MPQANSEAANLAAYIETVGRAMARAGVAQVELRRGPVKTFTLAPSLPPGLLAEPDAPAGETPEQRRARRERTLFAAAEGDDNGE